MTFMTFCITCEITAYSWNKKLNTFWGNNKGRRNILDCTSHPRSLFCNYTLSRTVFLHHCDQEGGKFSCLFIKTNFVRCLDCPVKSRVLAALTQLKKDATPSTSSPTQVSNRMHLRACHPAQAWCATSHIYIISKEEKVHSKKIQKIKSYLQEHESQLDSVWLNHKSEKTLLHMMNCFLH